MENSQWLAGIRHFFGRPFFSDPRTLLGLWLILGVVSALIKIHKCNNFLIFKYVFWHAWNQTSLYAQYPLEFFDSNHYGPFFSIIIASFYCIEKDITAACFIMIGTFVKLYKNETLLDSLLTKEEKKQFLFLINKILSGLENAN